MKRSTSQEPTDKPQDSSSLRPNLAKKLLGYSATVAACVAAAPDSEAVIVFSNGYGYNDFADFTIDAAGAVGDVHRMGFDIDDDGLADIELVHYGNYKSIFNTGGGGTIYPRYAGMGQPNAFDIDRVAADGSFYLPGSSGVSGALQAYPLRFGYGAMISASGPGFAAPANSIGPARGFLARSNGIFSGPNLPPFKGGSHWYLDGDGYIEGYLGIRFLSDKQETKDANGGNSTDVYGWVRIRVHGDSSTTQSAFAITVLDAAYRLDGMGIEAGTIPEPSSLGLLALGALGLIGTRRRAARQDRDLSGDSTPTT